MSDDRQEPPAGEDAADLTRPLPPSLDRTAPHQPLDRAAPQEPVDRTQRLPRPDDRTARQAGVPGTPPGPEPIDPTAPLPPTERTGPAAWSGRAEVPPPRPPDQREPAEWYAEEPDGRRWWTPILLGILALLLLGLLGVGLWLALRPVDAPAPEQSPSPGPTSAPVTTTAAPTSAAPTTTPPTTPPATTAAARVPMPPVVGLPRAAAEAILDALGLDHRVESRESDQPPGTVIETDPEAGELVREGQEVTIVVAEAAAPTTSATEPTPEPTPTR